MTPLHIFKKKQYKMLLKLYSKIISGLKLSEKDNASQTSALDKIIPAEINNDPFSEWIEKIALQEDVKTVIEIGSSSGDGSTKHFLETMAKRKDVSELKFACLELSKERYSKLKGFIDHYPFAYSFNLSSVSSKLFPTKDTVKKFYKDRSTKLNNFPLKTVLEWLEQDIKYIKDSGKDYDGITEIRNSLQIEEFDACLIDGSEFTGLAELHLLNGSKYILLDDTETYKCREAFEFLERSDIYIKLEHNPNVRNGFAIFKKKVLEDAQKKYSRSGI
tara:strand:+ start:59 stop:883 length:825 start_codon:yes stop_codon:yes gene_type:complete